MAGVERDPTELVQVKVRLRERLRQQLEVEAIRSGNNLTNEIVHRLERSLSEDEQKRRTEEIQGGWKTARLIKEITKAVQFFGVDCSPGEEVVTRAFLEGAITAILNERLSGWAGLMAAPMATPKSADTIVKLTPELERRAKARGAMIGHQITLTTRAAEQELAQFSKIEVESANGETLLQSATRLGLIGGDEIEAFSEAQANTKNHKKRA